MTTVAERVCDKRYLQAIFDNFSRRILAWKISETFDPSGTGMLVDRLGVAVEKPDADDW